MIRKAITAIKQSRRLQIVLLVFSIIILFQAYQIYHSHTEQQVIKQATLDYLQNVKSYDIDHDIADINVYLASIKEKTYMTTVIFSDEEDVIYFYAFEPNTTNIKQVDVEYAGGENKHPEFKHEENLND